jgi:hypothetical protein
VQCNAVAGGFGTDIMVVTACRRQQELELELELELGVAMVRYVCLLGLGATWGAGGVGSFFLVRGLRCHSCGLYLFAFWV